MLNYILLQATGAEGSGLMNIGLIIALVFIFYFFMIRPQQKRQKEIRKFREGIKDGDNVVTAGGIHGKVRKIKETQFYLEVAPGVLIRVEKNMVYPSAEEAATDVEANTTK